jgi:hypothetical protein
MRRNRRKNFRVEWHSAATIYDPNRRLARPCILSNFSNGGACITGIEPSTVPNRFILRIAGSRYENRECKVIWRSDRSIGVGFTDRRRKMTVPATMSVPVTTS